MLAHRFGPFLLVVVALLVGCESATSAAVVTSPSSSPAARPTSTPLPSPSPEVLASPLPSPTAASPATTAGNTWCAAYDLSRVPTRWVEGQSQTFIIRVFNCGTVTWPSDPNRPVPARVEGNLHFTLKPGGFVNQAYWLGSVTSHLTIPLGPVCPLTNQVLNEDIQPNCWAILKVTMTPSFHGHASLEASMVKVHEFWFDQVTSTPAQFASAPVSVSS
jgi:hypothetical protein